jgi:transcriptional regulator with XRE-family HTH domain
VGNEAPADHRDDAAELPEAFGPRLASLRRAAGYTQEEFAEAIGVSRRVIGYYEAESADTPPGSMLVAIAQVLTVSVDELLGLKRLPKGKASGGPHGNSRLMRKLKQLEQLPKAQQQAVIQHIDALSQANSQHSKSR